MTTTVYSLTTQKSWYETMDELENTFRLWGVTEWSTNNPRGAVSGNYQPQSEGYRPDVHAKRIILSNTLGCFRCN